MQYFYEVLNCLNRKKFFKLFKNNSNYRFPSIVKNNGKEGLTLSKVRREKFIAQIFRRDLPTREKARKNKNENGAFCLPFIAFFSHKVHNIRFKKQTRILSQLTVTELGRPVSKSSTRISKFHDPNDSAHKVYKTRIENYISIGFQLGTPWLRTYSHNYYTMVHWQCDGES